MGKVKLYQGDCLDVMKEFPDNQIDLTVTSPPYDNLRTYNDSLVWGWDVFTGIADQLFRVTKKGGVVVWVVGDATINGSETGTSFRQALYFMDVGFNLHDTMIYQKNNFSSPSCNRYHQVFEYCFILSKNTPHIFNGIKDRTNITSGQKGFGRNTRRLKNGELVEQKNKIRNDRGLRHNVWVMKTGFNVSTQDKIAFKHPATFPEKLVHDHIISWSNEGDTVLDPMMGSGTTGKMSKKLNRYFIGIE
ncbi:site-specific DNA-methyltransferase, partial [Candidatus Bathyarchaeota archaeon]|nr:site-specific DNA-methyltransferase [Candidatus Bathyarchaeota archaeon]